MDAVRVGLAVALCAAIGYRCGDPHLLDGGEAECQDRATVLSLRCVEAAAAFRKSADAGGCLDNADCPRSSVPPLGRDLRRCKRSMARTSWTGLSASSDLRSCGANKLGECKLGTETCLDGGWGRARASRPTSQACDSKDNDCDGLVVTPRLGDLTRRLRESVQLFLTALCGQGDCQMVPAGPRTGT